MEFLELYLINNFPNINGFWVVQRENVNKCFRLKIRYDMIQLTGLFLEILITVDFLIIRHSKRETHLIDWY